MIIIIIHISVSLLHTNLGKLIHYSGVHNALLRTVDGITLSRKLYQTSMRVTVITSVIQVLQNNPSCVHTTHFCILTMYANFISWLQKR